MSFATEISHLLNWYLEDKNVFNSPSTKNYCPMDNNSKSAKISFKEKKFCSDGNLDSINQFFWKAENKIRLFLKTGQVRFKELNNSASFV